jgi:ribonuclease BN (tRNA processing enzyme)
LIAFPALALARVVVLTLALHSPAAGPFADTARLVLLGTGTPLADADRSGPAVAIVVNGNAYLVDAGPGIVRRAAAAARGGTSALRVQNLKRVFITHLHSDHTLGLPDLMLSPAVLHRKAPLEVYGPPGIQHMVDAILDAYREDIRLRIDGLEHGEPAGYRMDVHEVQPGVVYRDSSVTVTAFRVQHGTWAYAYGYRFQTADRTIVVSGDTRPTDAVADACNGCDILVHEVYAQQGFDRLPAGDKAYHSTFHTSAVALGSIAARARAKLLVLYHQLFFGSSDEEILREVRESFDGRVVSGKDLEVY